MALGSTWKFSLLAASIPIAPLWAKGVMVMVEIKGGTLTSPIRINEISNRGQRIASHLRARGHGHSGTINEHHPHSNQLHLEWTPSRLVHLAPSIGPHTVRLFERILADKLHPEMGYRCLGQRSLQQRLRDAP